MKQSISFFSRSELALWGSSVALITGSFLIFDREGYAILLASWIGVTSLIFNAKGHPAGQLLMVIFSVIYGIISFLGRYYGETLTYLGMTCPMALFALISWLRHPFAGNRTEVAVNRLRRGEGFFLAALTAVVTLLFGRLLLHFSTSQIILSTVSVTTSFLAVYLTFRRSAYYALAYAANDIVLVLLWGIASVEEPSYLSVSVCFLIFLVNDLYGFLSWRKMARRQRCCG